MIFLKLFEEFTQEGTLVAEVSDVPIKLKVSSTESEKKRGYMFSDGPKEGEGMLFVYTDEQILSFWMKNVIVPLDILFFDSQRNLVDYQKMVPQKSEDDDVFYTSKLPAKFALELPNGWIDKHLDLRNSKLKFK